jgi:hypothetical protein
MKIEIEGPDFRWVRETAREVLALAFLAPASVLYRIGNKIAPPKSVVDPEEADVQWQEETPEVTAWRKRNKVETQTERRERERTGRGAPVRGEDGTIPREAEPR